MKTIIFSFVMLFTLHSIAQNIQGFESNTNGYTFTNMSVSNQGVICGGNSLKSSLAFKQGYVYSCTTPYKAISGPLVISFGYRIQLNNDSKNWIMSVMVFSDGSNLPVYTNTYTNKGNITNSSCNSNNFTATTSSLPTGNYKLVIGFATESNDNDQNNSVWLDNVNFETISALPVMFTSAPKITPFMDGMVTIQWGVAQESDIKRYNIEVSKDGGKTWTIIAQTIPSSSSMGSCYSVNAKIN